MQVKVLKDFKWSHNGRVSNYKAGHTIDIDSRNAEKMVKHGYAAKIESEAKMFDHDKIEDKMMHFEVENKSLSPAKKSKKSKEVENE